MFMKLLVSEINKYSSLFSPTQISNISHTDGVYMDICLFSKCIFYCNTDLLDGEYVFKAKYLLIFFAIDLKYRCVCYCILMDIVYT